MTFVKTATAGIEKEAANKKIKFEATISGILTRQLEKTTSKKSIRAAIRRAVDDRRYEPKTGPNGPRQKTNRLVVIEATEFSVRAGESDNSRFKDAFVAIHKWKESKRSVLPPHLDGARDARFDARFSDSCTVNGTRRHRRIRTEFSWTNEFSASGSIASEKK